MGGSKKTQTVEQKQTNDPWAPAIPFITESMGGAANLYRQGPRQTYSGPRVAAFADPTIEAFGNITQRARQPAMGLNGAMGAIDRAMGGQVGESAGGRALAGFLDTGPNPYLGDLFSRGARDITDTINSQFTMSGRYGSGAHTGQLARGLGDFATNLYGQAYETDANRRLSAAGQMIGFDQDQQRLGLGAAAMLPAMREYAAAGDMDLMRIGEMLQQQRQDEINADIAAFDERTAAPYQHESWYNGIVSGLGQLGGTQQGTTTTTQRQKSNPFMTALGAASAISGMFGNPFAGLMSGAFGAMGGGGGGGGLMAMDPWGSGGTNFRF